MRVRRIRVGRADARAGTRRITNGANAKHTSGPSSPSAIALRTIGLTAYATAAATPGAPNPRTAERKRYAPNAPSGSAPPTTSVRPGRCRPRATAQSSAISANTGAPAVGTHHGVAPGRRERRPRRADARPGLEATDLRHVTEEERPRTEHDEDRETDRGDDGNVRARGSRPRRGSGAVRDLGQPLPRVHAVEHEAAQARAAADHEIADVAVVDAAASAASTPVRAGAPVPRRNAENQPASNARAPCRTAREHEPERLRDVQHERERQHPQQRDRRVRLVEHAYPAAGERLQVALVVATGRARVLHRRPPVADAGVGRDEHARAGEPRPPAQVDVVRAGERLGVEAAELVEEVGAHEHRGVRHVEDVADAVVLLLVDLAGLDARERDAVVVDRHPDLEQHVGVVVVDELGPDDARVRAVGLLDQEPDRVGIEHDVVVAEEQEDGALDRAPAPRSRPPRTRRWPSSRRTKAPGRASAIAAVGSSLGPVVEHEDRQGRVVLRAEALERVLEPGSGVVRDDDRDDGGGD